jgi:hypothetical protein
VRINARHCRRRLATLGVDRFGEQQLPVVQEPGANEAEEDVEGFDRQMVEAVKFA